MIIDWKTVLRDYENVEAFHHTTANALYSLAQYSELDLGEFEEEWKMLVGLHMSLLGKILLDYVKEDPLTVVK